MADGQGGAPLKKKLFGWVQSALGKLEQALDEKPATEAPAEPVPARPATGGLPGQRASGPPGATGRLPTQSAQPGSGRLPGQRAAATGHLVHGTDSLSRSVIPPGSGPLTPSPPPPKDPLAEAAESAERMGFIIAYMNDPASDPIFQDKQMVYKVLTEERSYQQHLIVRLSEAGAQLAPDDPGRGDLDEQLATARNRQAQLFTLLKRLTGIRGKTGGTGFLAKSAEPPPDPLIRDTPGAP